MQKSHSVSYSSLELLKIIIKNNKRIMNKTIKENLIPPFEIHTDAEYIHGLEIPIEDFIKVSENRLLISERIERVAQYSNQPLHIFLEVINYV